MLWLCLAWDFGIFWDVLLNFWCALGADLADLGSMLTQPESQQLGLDRNAKQRSHDVPSFPSMTSQTYLAGFFTERFKNLSLWKELSWNRWNFEKKQKRDDSMTGTWHDKTASTEIIAQTRPEIDFTPKIMVVVPGGHILHWRAPISSWYLPGRMKIPEKSWGILAWWVCDWYL